MRPDLPSGTVTFLFTDVEGSTRLLHELGAAGYADALDEHRRVIREACAREGGVEVDTQGDAFFFAFPTATGGLAAATSFTEGLAAGPVQVRVGVHTGTPFVTEEGYVGEDVHLAARIAASAHGAQVVLSAATAAQTGPRDTVSQGVLLELGEHRLKDISEPVAIFQLGDATFPPLKTISNTNLPRPASTFLGRERELGEVLERIRGGARLVTLTGPGGTGKTRLAIEAASTLVPEYKAGVFWVGLAALRDPTLVPETIAQTLAAKDGLAEHIAERELLLLLDNLEQVIEAAPELASLLEACPNLTLLVTSRELLRVRGEVEYPVPPLAEPEAVSLFCERAQLEPSQEIAELCARLDSLPLAVELAAARTRALTVSQILERLTQRLDLLQGGRDADPRQQTLRATIEWSFDLLSDEEQRHFAALSVFAGGCTLEAAEEVCGADLDTLQSLVEKSLLRFTEGRYWMLETIREFAGERLEARDESETSEHALADWCLRMLQQSADVASAPSQLDRLDHEVPNLRAALRVCERRSPREYAEMASHLWGYWAARRHVDEGRRHIEHALERAAVDDRIVQERLLAGASWLAYAQGDLERAAVHGEKRLRVARDMGNALSVSRSLSMLGNLAAERGDIAQAVEHATRAIATHRVSGGPEISRAGLIHNLGVVWERAEQPDRASEAYSEARSVFEAAGDAGGIASETIALGSAALLAKNHADAHGLIAEGFRKAAASGVAESWVTVVLVMLAALEAEEANWPRAARHVGVVERLLDDAGEVLEGQHRRRFAATRETLVAQLGEKAFMDAIDDVRSISASSAVEYTLATLD